jgi:hypothetical protein
MQAACDPAAAKVAKVRATAVELLCLVGIKYGRVEEVAAALFRLATGQEHGPELVAQVVKAAETGHNNSQMVRGGRAERGGRSEAEGRGCRVTVAVDGRIMGQTWWHRWSRQQRQATATARW